ncbi:MAG: ATP synthase F1 subunit delta [Bacteroidales bacterium]|jgi:F-type H+-transporting ATPase subunit delta|nr:ATP synthase F1 subunit delta [Bacteroidales bacterium]
MNEGLIAGRYAQALLQYATEHKADTDLYGMMKVLADCYTALPNLQDFFGNRTIEVEKRKALFTNLFPEYAPHSIHVLSDFLDLLIRQKREHIMQSVALQYVEKYREHNGILYGVLTTTFPPDEELLVKVKKALQPDSPEKVELEWKEDKDLIGGFTLSVGMKEWDASLKTRLHQVKKSYGLT